MNTSAPRSASESEPETRLGFVCSASHSLCPARPSRPANIAPRLSQTTTSRAPRAVEDDAAVGEGAARDLQRVGERGGDDDGRAVLVVVKDGDVQLALEHLLYLKALGRGDVLEVYAAEAGRDGADGGDYVRALVHVEAERHGVHAAELLEEQGLALHDGHGGQRSDVPEPEHGGAVRDDGDEVPARGELPDGGRVSRDLAAGLRHAGGVGRGERVAVADGDLRRYLDLASVLAVHPQGGLVVIHRHQLLKLHKIFPGARCGPREFII